MSMDAGAMVGLAKTYRHDMSRLDPHGKDSNHIALHVIWDGGKVSGSERTEKKNENWRLDVDGIGSQAEDDFGPQMRLITKGCAVARERETMD
jgi:hypothetical protein